MLELLQTSCNTALSSFGSNERALPVRLNIDGGNLQLDNMQVFAKNSNLTARCSSTTADSANMTIRSVSIDASAYYYGKGVVSSSGITYTNMTSQVPSSGTISLDILKYALY